MWCTGNVRLQMPMFFNINIVNVKKKIISFNLFLSLTAPPKCGPWWNPAESFWTAAVLKGWYYSPQACIRKTEVPLSGLQNFRLQNNWHNTVFSECVICFLDGTVFCILISASVSVYSAFTGSWDNSASCYGYWKSSPPKIWISHSAAAMK